MVREPIPRLFALLGDPVAGNPTQEIVEDAFRRLGLDWRYVSTRVRPDDLAAAVAGLRALGFAGAHVTVPHKVAVVPLLDELSAAARAIGAVNCIVAHDGRLIGENTDGKGLVSAVSAVTEVARARVLLFGAGGAARAIGVELALAGARSIRLVSRDPARRAGVTAALAGIGAEVVDEPWPEQPITPSDATLVINATTIGMPSVSSADALVPVAWNDAAPGLIAADVVIAPSTPFTEAARAAGVTAVGGVDMLVEQAVLSVELWTGRRPDRAALRTVLEREITAAEGDSAVQEGAPR